MRRLHDTFSKEELLTEQLSSQCLSIPPFHHNLSYAIIFLGVPLKVHGAIGLSIFITNNLI